MSTVLPEATMSEASTTRSVSTFSTTTPEIDQQKQETIRKDFPETWLFINVTAE
jgi:hypothetical protein